MNFQFGNLLGAPYRGGTLLLTANELLSPCWQPSFTGESTAGVRPNAWMCWVFPDDCCTRFTSQNQPAPLYPFECNTEVCISSA